MKKLGFTLSELLIAVGIVAVVSIVVAPTITNIIPDKNKIKVISYYNKINEINKKLLSLPDVYTDTYNYDSSNNRRNLISSGFASTQKPISDSVPKVDGDNKYPDLFYYFITGKKPGGLVTSFDIDDGSFWAINSISNTTEIPHTIDISINIDIDGQTKGNNCFYSANCNSPDTFIFKVNEDGSVDAGDALTEAYLTNMTKINNQKEDKLLAKKNLKKQY